MALTYKKGSESNADQRTVCPHSFVTELGVWYLVAHCERSDGIRFFRLDRIQSLEVSTDRFDALGEVDLDAMLASGHAFAGSPPGKLSIRYSPRLARWIGERVKGITHADGSLEVEYPMADIGWAVRHVLQYGPEAEVLSPPEVRSEVVRRLESIVA